MILRKLKIYNAFDWQSKIEKVVAFLEENKILSKLEQSNEDLFHQIYLFSIRAKFNDVNDEEHLKKL